VVVLPGQVHGVAVADGEHVGGAVGETDTGARGGGLHDELGVVGDRVLERLLASGDPAERRVVVGAVVQGGQPAVGRVHHPGDQRGAVGAEHRLGGLDLHLEPHRRVREAELVLDRGGGVHERPHLLGARHLRQRHHEPVQRTARLGVRRQEPCQRAHASRTGRRLERLDADPRERWCGLGLLGLGQRVSRGAYVLVLVGVTERTPGPDVPVLEVDPQVLDRLVGQLGLDPPDDVGVTDHAGELVGVLVEQRLRLPTPVPRRVGGEHVGRHVGGVDRLSTGALTGVARRQLRVRLGEPFVQLGGEPRDQVVGIDQGVSPPW